MADDKSGRDARDRIVRAALELVEATGPSVLSMRQVAERAGVSVGTVSYHFPDKTELLEQCLDGLYDQLDAAWQAAIVELREQGTGPEVGGRILGGLFDLMTERRNLVRLRIMIAVDEGALPHHRLQRHVVRYADEISELLGQERDTLVFRLHAVYMLLARHVAMNLDEWRALTDLSPETDARLVVRGQVVDACLGVLGMRG